MRALNFVLLCTSFIALILVYGQKYRTEDMQSSVIELQQTIATKRQILNRLEANRAYLNQPSRLQLIVERNAASLNLQPIDSAQYGRIEDLPMRVSAPDNDALTALIESLASGHNADANEGPGANE